MQIQPPKELANPPPIPERRHAVYAYYKLSFDAAGCPMQEKDGRLVFHPLLAAYLVVDYITWFGQTGDDIYVDHAVKIARLAIAKCTYREGAAIFQYQQSDGLSYVPGDYYSALTQAWYVKALSTLRPHALRRINDGFDEELKAFYKSLLTPIAQGGVFIQKEYGWLVEEYPHSPPLYTLNGWLTVLRIIKDCMGALRDVGIEAGEFLSRNLDAVERLLPLYDAGFVYNSRYQLTGFTRLKLVFDKHVARALTSFSVIIPGEGEFPGRLEKSHKNRWGNFLERDEARLLQFNVVQSLISYPEPNRFRAALEMAEKCGVQIYAADGDYSPDVTGMPTQRWRLLASLELGAGDNSLDIALNFDGTEMFAYPTNFKKVIEGKHYNGYHFVHIIDLAELYGYTGRPVLKEYALKWLAYSHSWSMLPQLEDGKHSLLPHAHGAQFTERVMNALEAIEAQNL
jgi:hypothetical protein